MGTITIYLNVTWETKLVTLKASCPVKRLMQIIGTILDMTAGSRKGTDDTIAILLLRMVW